MHIFQKNSIFFYFYANFLHIIQIILHKCIIYKIYKKISVGDTYGEGKYNLKGVKV